MRSFAVLTVFALLAGCVATTAIGVSPVRPNPNLVATSKSTVADAMRDPESARFRNIVSYKVANGDVIICGEVNARNGFGGYAGYSTFYLRFREKELRRIQIDSSTDQYVFWAASACAEAASGTISLVESEL